MTVSITILQLITLCIACFSLGVSVANFMAGSKGGHR